MQCSCTESVGYACTLREIGWATMSDRRDRLEVIRDQLTEAMAVADVAVKAQIAGQLRQTLKEIDELPADTEGKSARERLADRVAAAHVVA